MVVSIIFFSLYLCALLTLLIGGLKQGAKEIKYFIGETTYEKEEISVIVPFRNESLRILPLIKSINKLQEIPLEFIFVDDHSTDNTSLLFQHIDPRIQFQVVQQDNGVYGKKKAIRKGVKIAQGKHILTIDADVEFVPTYFKRLQELQESDLYVLPVNTICDLKSEFLETDLVLAFAVNHATAGWSRPIMASGANLLFNKTVFEEVDDIERHEHVASGDDAYLLRTMQLRGRETRLVTDDDLTIRTKAPETISRQINQRLRWLGKTVHVNDQLNTLILVVQGIFTLVFLGLLFYYFMQGLFVEFLIIWSCKSLLDQIMLATFFIQKNFYRSLLLLPIYELFFPVYTLVILIYSKFSKQQWKERMI